MKSYITVMFIWLTLTASAELKLTEQVDEETTAVGLATIFGRVCDSEGSGVPGVRVTLDRLAERNEILWWEEARVSTDGNGSYVFSKIDLGLTYRIHAGGVASTPATSKEFAVQTDGISQVPDLVVRPATSKIRGTLLKPDGTTGANIAYSYGSAAFWEWRMYPDQYLRTGSDGSFVLDHVLPDEPVAFWVVPESEAAQVWRGLPPDTSDLRLRMDPAKYVDLPPEWSKMGDLQSIAFCNSGVVNRRLQFSLPDLQGNPVSLKDSRFMDKVVLVNLWGTWCGGCIREVPVLVGIQQKYGKQGLEIVGIAFENGDHETQLKSIKGFLERTGINYTLVMGGTPTKQNVELAVDGIENFNGFPTTILIGRDGMVNDIHVGFRCETPERLTWQTRTIEESIERLLTLE